MHTQPKRACVSSPTGTTYELAREWEERTCERDRALASSTSALWLRGHVPERTRRISSSTVVIFSSGVGPVGSGRLRLAEMIIDGRRARSRWRAERRDTKPGSKGCALTKRVGLFLRGKKIL